MYTPPPVETFALVTGGTLPASSKLGAAPVATFYIGKTEVTWGEWQTVRAWAVENGYPDLKNAGRGCSDNHPVSNVNWYDVVKWCNARSEKEGKTPVYKNATDVYRTGDVSEPEVDYSANGYRLPSEEEWEFAARGGTQTNGYTYSGGNDLSDVGWYSENSCGAVNEVGNKIANELGIFDMSGNLREWTGTWDADWHGILTRSVLKHGLPKQVGAKGWISESQTFKYNDQPFAFATEESKGWIFVSRDDDGNGKPSYKDVDELVEVCRAIIEGTDQQSDLLVNVANSGLEESEEESETRIVRLEDRDADVKSWEYEIDINEDQFWDIIITKLIETGELDEPSEGEEIDHDDINVNDFLYNYAAQTDAEQSCYSFIYGVAYMEFDDGFEIGMEMRNSNLHVHYYDSQAYQSSSLVLRGGSWGGDGEDCAVVGRTLMAAEDSDANSGFRIALSVSTPSPIGTFALVTGGTLPASSELGAVPVATFYIGKTEVTWGEWQLVRTWAVANGYTDLANVGEGVGDSYPVTHVNWYDVVKWCNARSEKEGKIPVYKNGANVYRTGNVSEPAIVASANGYRLPSEKEWEFAARGGTQTQGYTYSGSNDLNAVGWYDENSDGAVHEVGKKQANELGIYDMSGNLWEWSGSWYPGREGYRVIRGGGWDDYAEGCTVALRYHGNPGNRDDDYGSDLGFRVALSSVP